MSALPPGKYTLRVVLIYGCKDKDHRIVQPDMKFRILEGKT